MPLPMALLALLAPLMEMAPLRTRERLIYRKRAKEAKGAKPRRQRTVGLLPPTGQVLSNAKLTTTPTTSITSRLASRRSWMSSGSSWPKTRRGKRGTSDEGDHGCGGALEGKPAVEALLQVLLPDERPEAPLPGVAVPRRASGPRRRP